MTGSQIPVPSALLEVDRLCVNFGPSRVVDRVSFTIASGEKFGLVGESGSGKSVTALSILKLVDAASYDGEIRFRGENLLAKTERQMQGLRGRDIAMIFQEPMTALNPLYMVGNQIAEVLELHEGLDKRTGPCTSDRAARPYRHSGTRAARRCVSSSTLRRPATTGHDRDGACVPAAVADRR